MSPDRRVGFEVARPGHTVETLDGVTTGPAGAVTELVVPLSRAEAIVELQGNLTLAGASTHPAARAHVTWQAQEIPFGRAEAQPGYLARLVETSAILTWVNGPAGAGDLAIGFGRSSSEPDGEGPRQVRPGEQREEGLVGFTELYDAGWRRAGTLYAGPAAGSAFVAPLGLGWHLEVRALFDGDLDAAPTPDPGVALVLAALLVGAWTLRARRSRP